MPRLAQPTFGSGSPRYETKRGRASMATVRYARHAGAPSSRLPFVSLVDDRDGVLATWQRLRDLGKHIERIGPDGSADQHELNQIEPTLSGFIRGNDGLRFAEPPR